MNPIIEQKIISRNNKVLAVAAFMSLGVASVAVVTHQWASLSLSVMALPFLIDGLATKVRFNKNSPYALDSTVPLTSYPKVAQKWFTDYFDGSKSLTEKKYQIVCLKIWLSHKRLKFSKLFEGYSSFQGNERLDLLAREIVKAGESKHHINFIFQEYSSSVRNSKFTEVTPILFLKEDLCNSKKLEIARNVYQEYSHLGMAGSALVADKTDFEALMVLQDYKLTDVDMKIINEFTKKYENENSDSSVMFFKPEPEPSIDIEILGEIISKENNTDNLEILKNLYKLDQKFRTLQEDKESMVHISNMASKKIDYINLKGKFNDPAEPIKLNKRLKL